jgi:pimeloyl-ACP methyl ester carboxylesterase
VAVDLPGFGLSGPPRLPRLGAYAEDVAVALRALRLPPCTVIGHSLGGAVATALAENIGDGVAALVLCAPAGFGRLRGAELAALPIVPQLAAGSLPRLLASSRLTGLVAATLLRFGLQPTVEVRRRLAADIARAGPGACAALRALAGAGRSPAGFHRRPVAYDGPVTVLWGDRDHVIPHAHADALRTALPHADLHIWPGAGHFLHRDRPHDLAALVEQAIGGWCAAARRQHPIRSAGRSARTRHDLHPHHDGARSRAGSIAARRRGETHRSAAGPAGSHVSTA